MLRVQITSEPIVQKNLPLVYKSKEVIFSVKYNLFIWKKDENPCHFDVILRMRLFKQSIRGWFYLHSSSHCPSSGLSLYYPSPLDALSNRRDVRARKKYFQCFGGSTSRFPLFRLIQLLLSHTLSQLNILPLLVHHQSRWCLWRNNCSWDCLWGILLERFFG